MYKTTWGKVGEKLLKKVPKNTQMFEKPFPQFLLKYQLKPLISLNYTNLSTTPHNPKVVYHCNKLSSHNKGNTFSDFFVKLVKN